MPITNEMLTLWDLGHRMAGKNPFRWRFFRVPFAVRDNFRLLLNEILHDHLQTDLRMTKWEPGMDSTPEMHIHHHLDAIHEGIYRGLCSKRFLKSVVVDRWEFHHWCLQSGYPLPAFWYGCDYQEDDEDALIGEDVDTEELVPEHDDPHGSEQSLGKEIESIAPLGQAALRLVSEPRGQAGGGAGWEDDEDAVVAMTGGPVLYEPAHPDKLRPQQRIMVACQVVAESLWDVVPTTSIAEMIACDDIQRLCGAGHYKEKTIRRWLNRVAPLDVRDKRGRPRKNSKHRINN
jgi:hypothetical protein